MDFSNAKELLELCDSNKMSISEVMKQRVMRVQAQEKR